MQLDYPSVAAVWSDLRRMLLDSPQIGDCLAVMALWAVADRAGAHNRQLLGKALARANHEQNVGIQWVSKPTV